MRPDDSHAAWTISLTQYVVQDDVLYHVADDGTLRVIPPTDTQEGLFKKAHGGIFGAHLSDRKVYCFTSVTARCTVSPQ